MTEKFINPPNRAKDVVLRTAIEEHIPILPVTLEKGLGSAFSENCAKIQIVPRYNNDSTATPYEEVLKTFLNSVLVSDELARKVRAAFDALAHNDGSLEKVLLRFHDPDAGRDDG